MYPLHGSIPAMQCKHPLLPAVRDSTRVAVYDYWLAKRRRLGKPIMRRLQAPTPIADSNPYNVFRWGGRAASCPYLLFFYVFG